MLLGMAGRADHVLLNFADFVKNIVRVSAFRALIVIIGHREFLSLHQYDASRKQKGAENPNRKRPTESLGRFSAFLESIGRRETRVSVLRGLIGRSQFLSNKRI